MIMRRIIVFMVVALALLQAWSVMGQNIQDSLTLSSEVDAPAALTDFLNDTVNDTVNETVTAPPLDANLTATQSAFLDLPVNQSLIDTNLTTTASQGAFLDLPVNQSLIDTTAPGTLTQREFVLGEPVVAPEPFFKKGQMMGSGTFSSSAEPAPSFYQKGQMMGT